jgi:hypothetical protein
VRVPSCFLMTRSMIARENASNSSFVFGFIASSASGASPPTTSSAAAHLIQTLARTRWTRGPEQRGRVVEVAPELALAVRARLRARVEHRVLVVQLISTPTPFARSGGGGLGGELRLERALLLRRRGRARRRLRRVLLGRRLLPVRLPLVNIRGEKRTESNARQARAPPRPRLRTGSARPRASSRARRAWAPRRTTRLRGCWRERRRRAGGRTPLVGHRGWAEEEIRSKGRALPRCAWAGAGVWRVRPCSLAHHRHDGVRELEHYLRYYRVLGDTTMTQSAYIHER